MEVSNKEVSMPHYLIETDVYRTIRYRAGEMTMDRLKGFSRSLQNREYRTVEDSGHWGARLWKRERYLHCKGGVRIATAGCLG